jgi:ubiquinone/menaquinone biosynthesis C-methylase UbiE
VACSPPAARVEQQLADTRVWPWAERWVAARALHPFRARPSFRRLRILNVDHGPGGMAIALRQVGPLDATIVGTDAVAGMSDLARQRALGRGVRLPPSFLGAWSYALPFADGTFDLVVSSGALHDWPDPEAVLAEMRRVLRPDGRYFIADFRRDVPLWVWVVVSAIQALVTPKDLREIGEPTASVRAAYAPHEAEWLAARARLPDIRVMPGVAWLVITRNNGAASPH